MKSGQEKRDRERYSLAETREALLENYYERGGDMKDYKRIGQVTGLSALDANEIAKRRGWIHTREK